ncbi:thioredoxin family protein [bacterium]|nr:thioredoxin family protein [bacterium]
MKSLILPVLFIMLVSINLVLAEEDVSTGSLETVPANYEEAFETGKPVVVFFYTTKACNCVKKRCLDAKASFESYYDPVQNDVVYLTINDADNPELGKKFKVRSFPTVLIFNTAKEELSRLLSSQISRDNIDKVLAELEPCAGEDGDYHGKGKEHHYE